MMAIDDFHWGAGLVGHLVTREGARGHRCPRRSHVRKSEHRGPISLAP